MIINIIVYTAIFILIGSCTAISIRAIIKKEERKAYQYALINL